MKAYEIKLASISAYSQSRFYEVEKLDREQAAEYESRTWRNRMHVDQSGQVFIPPMALKNCLSEAAKFFSMQIPGKGKSTFTKHFEAGVLVTDPVKLGVRADDVVGEWLFVPASGKRGDGKRVKKCFPIIHQWSGVVTVYVLDEIITEKVLIAHLDVAGKFIGLGRFRPRNNGFYGRFQVEDVKAVN
jgi:hypothetical protein